MTIEVRGVNDPPVAKAMDAVVVTEDESRLVSLKGTDVEGSPLTYMVDTLPQFGTLTGEGASLTYTPHPNFEGTDTFTYKTSDGQLESEPAAVVLHVQGVNDFPVVKEIPAQEIQEGEAFAVINLDDYVEDVDNTKEEIAWSVNGESPLNVTIKDRQAVIVVPDENWNGEESLTFQATDADGLTNTNSLVSVNFTVLPVNDPPVALAVENVTTEEQRAIVIELNGTDVDGDRISYVIVSAPSHGALTGELPRVTYTPARGFWGEDGFTFVTEDGELRSDIATVRISVAEVLSYRLEKGAAKEMEEAEEFGILSALSPVGKPLKITPLTGDENPHAEIPRGGFDLSLSVGGSEAIFSETLKAKGKSSVFMLSALFCPSDIPVLYGKMGAKKWRPVEKQSYQDNLIVAHITHFGVYQVFTPQEGMPFQFGKVYVYPNPSKEDVASTLHIEVGRTDSLKVRIYDVSGDLVEQRDIQSAPIAVEKKMAYEEKLDKGRYGWGAYFGVVVAEKQNHAPLSKKFQFAIRY